MGLGDAPEIDIVENNEVDEKELKRRKSDMRWEIFSDVCRVLAVIVIALGISILITVALDRATIGLEKIDKLEKQVSQYQTEIDILNKEVESLKVFVDKPIEDYTVEELFTIDMVKEFDATYRQELDDDPNLGEYILLDSKDISDGFLKHRADSDKQPVLIERVFGIVTDADLNGRVIDAGGNGYYISYARVKGAQKGDLVVSYMMYEKNNYPDDIAVREDFVIKLK